VEYESADGVLSEAGEARARVLARLLGDAGITAIYTSDRKRTNQTAQPLAESLHITPTIVSGQDQVEATIRLVRARHDKGSVLIVGHSNTVPRLLKALGHSDEVAIGEREHDDIFVVLPIGDGRTTVVRLNY
jgi:broad specificity phosphatase PhoE